MTDRHTQKQRSYNMSRIKSSGTRIEEKLKPIMKVFGFTYQPKGVFGRPDFANKREKIAVFVDSCFWHRCPKHYKSPDTNKKFWREKINRNAERDKEVTKRLKHENWRVVRIWEHSLKAFRK